MESSPQVSEVSGETSSQKPLSEEEETKKLERVKRTQRRKSTESRQRRTIIETDPVRKSAHQREEKKSRKGAGTSQMDSAKLATS